LIKKGSTSKGIQHSSLKGQLSQTLSVQVTHNQSERPLLQLKGIKSKGTGSPSWKRQWQITH